jgi:hypothetical protein
LSNKWKFNGVSSKSQWFLNLVTMVLHMEFKLNTKGFSMDINFFLIGFSIFNIPIWSYVKVMSCGVYHLGFLIDTKTHTFCKGPSEEHSSYE